MPNYDELSTAMKTAIVDVCDYMKECGDSLDLIEKWVKAIAVSEVEKWNTRGGS